MNDYDLRGFKLTDSDEALFAVLQPITGAGQHRSIENTFRQIKTHTMFFSVCPILLLVPLKLHAHSITLQLQKASTILKLRRREPDVDVVTEFIEGGIDLGVGLSQGLQGLLDSPQ